MEATAGMSDSGPTQANFCYHCGRRINKQVENCWYCSMPTRRWIRAPKRCHFCGEQVRQEAVKCRHCGEFIDGRPRETAAPPSQIIFVVDRQLLHGMPEARLLSGQPVPPEVARLLDVQTVRAIETGQPRLLTQPGVRALPAPAIDESDVSDVEPVSRHQGGRALPAPPGANPPAIRTQPPARRGGSLPTHPGAAAGVGKALIKAGGWLARRMLSGPPPRPEGEPIDATAADRYRICERCQTEILTEDNFCYNCGTQYHKAKVVHQEVVIKRPEHVHSGQFLFTILLIAAHAVLKLKLVSVPHEAIAQPATACVAAGLSVLGLFRRGWLNKFFSLLLALIAAAALLLWK